MPPIGSNAKSEVRMKELNEFIGSLPEDGEWWKSSSEDIFREVAKTLNNQGVGIDTIKDCLSKIYDAMSAEFGS